MENSFGSSINWSVSDLQISELIGCKVMIGSLYVYGILEAVARVGSGVKIKVSGDWYEIPENGYRVVRLS